MSEIMTGYKLVRNASGELRSFSRFEQDAMTYVPGVEVTPHSGWGPAFVFTDRGMAELKERTN